MRNERVDQSLVTSAATIIRVGPVTSAATINEAPAAGTGRKKEAGVAGGAGFLGEFVEECVFAVVRGPDGEVVAEGDAALGGFPEQFGIGMLREFIEADVAAI